MTEIENLYGCYLLVSKNPKFRGRTYIGYTVDPLRRIQQHNKGFKSGGARRTSKRGPWEMVLIVYGFPNEPAALRFEWAWQHPDKSRRLYHVKRKQMREKAFNFYARIMFEMVCTTPWKLFALTICWLKEDAVVQCPVNLTPPLHMPIVYGPVRAKKVIQTPSPSDNSQEHIKGSMCVICDKLLKKSEAVCCLVPSCSMTAHVICLAKTFLSGQQEELLPIQGNCPSCHQLLLWGDLIRYKTGCYRYLKTQD